MAGNSSHTRKKGDLGAGSLAIIALANRPTGVTSVEVRYTLDCTDAMAASGLLNNLVKRGLLSRARASGERNAVYRTTAGADWSTLPVPVVPQIPQRNKTERVRVEKVRQRMARYDVVKQPPTIGPTVVIPSKRRHSGKGCATDAAVVIPEWAKITRTSAPLYDTRYSVDPSERIVGGFATLGIGTYL